MSKVKCKINLKRRDYYTVDKDGVLSKVPLVTVYPGEGGLYNYSISDGVTIDELKAAVEVLDEWEAQHGTSL